MLSNKEFLAITASPKLNQYRLQGIELLRLSRSEALIHPKVLLEFQKRVLNNIQKLERDLDNVKKESKDFIIIKHIIRCFKQLVDGMALRLLHFNPHAYRILSENRQLGRLSKREGLHEELKQLENVAKEGKFAILNDLTNFIRFGDITIIDKGHIKLLEIKTGKGVIGQKNSTLSTQVKKMQDVEKMVNESSAIVRNESARMLIIPVRAKSYKSKVMSLIKRANKDGIAYYDVDEFIKLKAINAAVCVNKKIDIKEKSANVKPFPKNDEVISSNNSDFSWSKDGEFLRGSFPLPVFHMPSFMIADLMYCRVLVSVKFNFTKFIAALEKKGFEVKISTKNPTVPIGERYNKKVAPFEKSSFDIIKIKKNDRMDNWSMNMPTNLIPRITHEYLKPESAIDLIDYFYNSHGLPHMRRQGLVMPIFNNHLNMWR